MLRSPPGCPGPKPDLISWMEQGSEAWSPAAQDPELGERVGGALRGEGPRASPHPAPGFLSGEVVIFRSPLPPPERKEGAAVLVMEERKRTRHTVFRT